MPINRSWPDARSFLQASRQSFRVGAIDLVECGAEWSRERKATREESQALGTVLKTVRQVGSPLGFRVVIAVTGGVRGSGLRRGRIFRVRVVTDGVRVQLEGEGGLRRKLCAYGWGFLIGLWNRSRNRSRDLSSAAGTACGTGVFRVRARGNAEIVPSFPPTNNQCFGALSWEILSSRFFPGAPVLLLPTMLSCPSRRCRNVARCVWSGITTRYGAVLPAWCCFFFFFT